MATKNKMIRIRLDDETRERLLNIVVKYGFKSEYQVLKLLVANLTQNEEAVILSLLKMKTVNKK
jgi:hypothetical protein